MRIRIVLDVIVIFLILFMLSFNKKILRILARRIVKKYQPKIIVVAGGGEETETRQAETRQYLVSAKKMISRILAAQFLTRESKNLFDGETDILLAIIGAETRHCLVSAVNIFAKALKIILTKQKYPEFLILEIEIGQIEKVKSLFKIVRPEVVIISGAEKLSNSKQSVKEKNSLIKRLRKNELAILNCDDKAAKNIIEGARAKIITFGFSEKADIRATEVISENSEKEIRNWKLEIKEDNYLEGGSHYGPPGEKEELVNFKINYQNAFVPVRLTRRQIYPALAAAAVGLNYDLNLVEIAEALGNQE